MPRTAGTKKSTTVTRQESRARTVDHGHQPTEEDVRYRAYEIYLRRGGGHGYDLDDWLKAERELGRVG